MASQSPLGVWGRRTVFHARITTDGDGAAADFISHVAWCRWKYGLLFHSTVDSRRVTTGKSAFFRRWLETGNRKIKWKLSSQRPGVNCTYFEVQLQRGADLTPPGDIRNTFFLVGWVLFPWLYWQGWTLCRVLASVGAPTRDPRRKAVTWRKTLVNPLLSHYGILLQRFEQIQQKTEWNSYSCIPVETVFLQSCRLTFTARFKCTAIPLQLKWDYSHAWC